MDKRIHIKRSPNLQYWHYLLHFKWPLFGLLIFLILICFAQLKLTYYGYLFGGYTEDFDSILSNVLYPTDVFGEDNRNISILNYFTRKDQLKAIDDEKSMRKNQKVILPLRTNRSTSDSYLILEFTPVFKKPRFCSHSREQIFGRTCPYTNCEYTCDQKHQDDADVLLMHKRDLDFHRLDTMKRHSEQIWLLWHDESNENTPAINRFRFNWTITYRISAEASLGAYGITTLKQKSWSNQDLNSWINQQFDKRYNQAVWFVSNCRPKVRLQKFYTFRDHYPVAAFGKCIPSNLSLSLDARVQSKLKCDRQSSCEKVYLTTSKFYLAFESQSCTDYVTEKFWRTLSVGAIPIVSGPERQDFVRIAPPHSFIHVDDYGSDAELAKALHRIGTNRLLYGKYHAWRRHYAVYYEANDVDPYRFCELCYRLNTNEKRTWYENVNDWFLEKC